MKKLNLIHVFLQRKQLTQHFLIMNFFIMFILLGTFSLFATEVNSQTMKVSIHHRDSKISDVLNDIENQTDYLFFYNHKDIKSDKKVSIDADDKAVSSILDQLFKDTEVRYAMVNNHIVLSVNLPANTITKENEVQTLQQQTKRITGLVKDTNGEPLMGVTIVVKGTTRGTVTGMDGQFEINIPVENSVLSFSLIGFTSQDISLENKTDLLVIMQENALLLNEVVVVGYGTQKKVNLTGAIATVGGDELEGRPVTSAAQALQGKIANLNVYSSDGKPGEKAKFNIRGYAGLGDTANPLVIIDGVTGYFDDINPNDIESITVLKDAAASSIYGAQAAYGVILITTKSGKRNEDLKITYNNNISFNTPTVLPKTAGSLEFARLFREASINEGGGGVIDEETMQRIEQYYYNPGSIPNNVPQLNNPERWSDWGDGRSNANEDWAKAMFKKWQTNHSHNIAVTGGSEKSTYMMSLGYLDTSGKLRYYDDYYKRYNLNAKLSTDVTPWLTVNLNVRYAKEETETPAYYLKPDGGINELINWTWAVWPTIPVHDPNGHFSPAGRMAFIAQANPDKTITDNLWLTGGALFKILPGLTGNFDFTYNKWAAKRTYSKGLIYSWSVSDEPYLDSSSQETSQIWQRSDNDDFSSLNAYLTYEKEIKGHTFKLLAGFQQEYKQNWGLYADKRSLILTETPSISTATGATEADDTLDHWTTRGYFGRINYDYKSKYLLEGNIRRDGSSRYPKGNKWGTFPSVSAGWNIARESFFESLTDIVSELKIRGSYGELGNMRGKSYQYISTLPYEKTLGYIINGERVGGFTVPSMIAFNTWEITRSLDFGIDISALKNRLILSFDWYQRDIIGLITKGETLPGVLGAESPNTNNADVRNRGFEISVNWRDHFVLKDKEFNYNVFANLSDYQGKVIKYSNPSRLISDHYVGKKMGEIWGYTSDHIMIDAAEAEEVNNTGFQQKFGGNWSRGDMKYKDLNGDNKIDDGKGTLDDHGDLSVIGNETPRFNFGFGFNAEWNNFDLSVFFQGTAKRDVWLSGKLAWGIGQGQWDSNVWKNTLDCWREDGSNLDPYWPRFYLGNTSKNLQKQTKYLDNAAYCRLKNVRLGYTLPQNISKKVFLEKVRVYVSGDNLLTFTKINENFDPESPGSSLYPLSRTWSFGLNVTF